MLEYHCGALSHVAIIDAKMIPRTVRIAPADCADAFKTGRLRVTSEIVLNAEEGKLSMETIYHGGEIQPDGSCTGRPK